jgi:nucleoside-diphosphate-sugar epimerase
VNVLGTGRMIVLGYEPKVPLEEGMRRCEEWLRSEALVE